jgi:hypothetical protein
MVLSYDLCVTATSIKMFIVDTKGVARRKNYYWPRKPRQKAVSSKTWFQQDTEFLERRRYDEAFSCFEEALRLGHPQAAKAIALCRK